MATGTIRATWFVAAAVCAGLGAGCSGDETADGAGATGTSSAAIHGDDGWRDWHHHHGRHHRRHGRGHENEFEVHRLVSDDPVAVPAEFTDPLLQNAWGLASSPTSPWWVANNGSNTSTLYNGEGVKQALEVSVPDNPTGLVFHAGSDFVVTNGSASGPAVFIFATEGGTIEGWNPGVPPPPPSHTAITMVPDAGHGAVYKGLAIATTSSGQRIYATDFHNNRVDVFDGTWQPVTTLPSDAFTDRHLPAHYAPFGIRNLNGTIFVTYALQDADAHDDVKGEGHGFVDAYDTDGGFLFRVASRGDLNSPWGLVIAPDDFGPFGGTLLVGNFGDGMIHAFDLDRCRHRECDEVGELRDEHHDPIVIDGLWALDFGHDNANSGDSDELYFTSGPDDEAHGLFGYIEHAED